jgi:hypothetical protein
LGLAALSLQASSLDAAEGSGGLDTVELRRIAEASPGAPDAWFNLGLAAARADKLGEAAWALERAHALNPWDREARDARDLVGAAVRRARAGGAASASMTEGEPRSIAWWRAASLLPLRPVYGLAVALSWTMWLAFVVWCFSPHEGRRRAAGVVALAAGLLLPVVVTAWGAARWTREHVVPVVVVAERPLAKAGPDELAGRVQTANLYEGAVLSLLEQRGAWSEVRLVDGASVWVATRSLRPIASIDAAQ